MYLAYVKQKQEDCLCKAITVFQLKTRVVHFVITILQSQFKLNLEMIVLYYNLTIRLTIIFINLYIHHLINIIIAINT